MAKVIVETAERRYPVRIGAGAVVQLHDLLTDNAVSKRVFVIFDAQVYALYGSRVEAQIRRGRLSAELFALPSGERTKNSRTISRLHDFLLGAGITRADFILAVGGGVLSDIVGYAAATVLRGVSWGIVSTTLLGMVDAAIGGKTGVNHRHGKNLLGAFWQPKFVLCDTDHLNTLPDRDLLAGLGEVVKYGGLLGPPLSDRLARLAPKQVVEQDKTLTGIIRDCVRYKASIVARDEREGSVRALLNLGHTFAHGIERACHGRSAILHGEAVLIGLLAACELSVRTAGVGTKKKLSAYRSTIARYVRLIPYRRIDGDLAWRTMQADKKRSRGRLRFVLLSEPGRPFLSDTVTPRDAKAALKSALEMYAES